MNKELETLLKDGIEKETDLIPVIVDGGLLGHYVIGMDKAVENSDSSSITITTLSPGEIGRTVFAIYNNECITMNVKTDMEHRIHLKKNFGVLPDDYAHLIRGYIIPGKIIFYKTTGFKKIDDIPEDVMKLVITAAIKIFSFGKYEICITNNGKIEILAYYEY